MDEMITLTLRRSHLYAILILLAFGAGFLAGRVSSPGTDVAPVARGEVLPTPAPAATLAQAGGATQAARVDVPIDGYPSIGPKDAKIVIVEFSDFECPYCRRHFQQTYRALLDAYPDQIRYVFRNLPLTSIHAEALPAAIAARCANEQARFWEYHDKLFSSDVLGQEVYVQYAADLGLDATAFRACLASGGQDAFIQADRDYAVSIGVRSTPTFYINGIQLVGAQSLAAFQSIIDKELAG
jgi:protein-disulfide isomerase